MGDSSNSVASSENMVDNWYRDAKNRAMKHWDGEAHKRACDARSPLSDFINPMMEACQNANLYEYWDQEYANLFCGNVEKSHYWWLKRDDIYWKNVRACAPLPDERYIKSGILHDNTQWIDNLSDEDREKAYNEARMITEIMVPMKRCIGFANGRAVWAQPRDPGHPLLDEWFFTRFISLYYLDRKISPRRKAKEERAAAAWFAWVYEERAWAVHWKKYHPGGPGYMALEQDTLVGKGLKRAREE